MFLRRVVRRLALPADFRRTTPLVAANLVQRTADDFAPVYYLMGLGIFSLIAVLSIPETRGKPLA